MATLEDPDFLFYTLLSPTSAEKPAFNIAFYRSDAMQAVLEQARSRQDPNERIKLYQQAQAIFHRDAPWVPLLHTQEMLAIDRRVKNVKIESGRYTYLRNIYLVGPLGHRTPSGEVIPPPDHQ